MVLVMSLALPGATHGASTPKFKTPASAAAPKIAPTSTSASTTATRTPSTARTTTANSVPITPPASSTTAASTPSSARAPVTPAAGTAAPTTTTPGLTRVPAVSPPPGGHLLKPNTVHTRGAKTKLSEGAIIALALAALLVLACLVWGAAHWWAYEPAWWISARHSLDEANFHVSETLSEFADWMRLGR
jgi:hypothetical protein